MQYCSKPNIEQLNKILSVYHLSLKLISTHKDIPGSFWGDSEAGLIGNTLFIRKDTPVHSALHEACHYICMDGQRRSSLHTNAGGDYDEENGVCYLQILLGEKLPSIDRNIMFNDMDEWGYSFRLGSTQKWFHSDADDAQKWLIEKGILDAANKPTGKLRE